MFKKLDKDEDEFLSWDEWNTGKAVHDKEEPDTAVVRLIHFL